MSQSLNQFFAPVGKVIVLFNQIETSLIIFAGGMCLPELGAVSALMAEASFGRKLDALKCIADEKVRGTALHERMTNLIKRLQTAEDIRNRVAHTVWTTSVDGYLIKMKWSAKRKTGNLPGPSHTTLQEIEQMGQEVQAIFTELIEVMRSLQKAGVLKITFVQD